MEHFEEKDGHLIRSFIPVRLAIKDMIAGGKRVYTNPSKNTQTSYTKGQLELYKKAGTVWIQLWSSRFSFLSRAGVRIRDPLRRCSDHIRCVLTVEFPVITAQTPFFSQNRQYFSCHETGDPPIRTSKA
jgi:hypothetical protein